MSAWAIDYVGPGELTAIMRPRDAVAAITDALRAGLEPGDDPPRTVLNLPNQSGQMLTMPSVSRCAAGVKVITGAPGNPALGLPRIQGVHLVFEPTTLQLVAAVDGAALTALRTPAVSVAAVLPLLKRRNHPMGVVVFGAPETRPRWTSRAWTVLRSYRPLPANVRFDRLTSSSAQRPRWSRFRLSHA